MERQPYRPEGIDKTILGVTFEEFSRYTDDEVVAFRERVLESGKDPVHPGFATQDGISDAIRLGDFRSWRKFGVPDREVNEYELEDRLIDLVEILLARSPNYGALPPIYDTYTDDQRQIISHLVDYFDQMRAPYEYLSLDDYSLVNTIGYSDEQIDWLTDQGILESNDEHFSPFGGYRYFLTQPYIEAYLLRTYMQLKRKQED